MSDIIRDTFENIPKASKKRAARLLCDIDLDNLDIPQSPLTGSLMALKNEVREITIGEKTLNLEFAYYHCEESDEKFTNTELDGINLERFKIEIL